MAKAKKIASFVKSKLTGTEVTWPTSLTDLRVSGCADNVFDDTITKITTNIFSDDPAAAGAPWGAENALIIFRDKEVKYSCDITCTCTNCSKTSGPESIKAGGTATLVFAPDNGYILPPTIIVTGAEKSWDQNNATLTLSNPTDDVSVTIAGIVNNCLCFTANYAGPSIGMSVTGTPTKGQNFQYTADCATWNIFTPGTTTITLTNAGDKIYFKGDNPNGVNEMVDSMYFTFTTSSPRSSGAIAVSGNIMSLIDNGACDTLVIPCDYCFYRLFNRNFYITTPPELPATTLTKSCYLELFSGCRELTVAPELPATTLTAYCYGSMFANTNITKAPKLPALVAPAGCYNGMFGCCYKLTTVPNLPATSVQNDSYSLMFSGCTALQVYKNSGSGHTYEWLIAAAGSHHEYMFYDTIGDYTTETDVYIYYSPYTQNKPV